MKQKGVRKQYAFNEDSVEERPELLESNAGATCTEKLVDDCIQALQSLGYGLGATPSELAAEKASIKL